MAARADGVRIRANARDDAAVDQPWRIGDDDEVEELHPVVPSFRPGDWTAVERWLAVRLPEDYKDLIGEGSALTFDRELMIASPFGESNPNGSSLGDMIGYGSWSLGDMIGYGSWSLAYLRHHFPAQFNVALFPESGGLLCWGIDGGGGVYYWDTSRPDPNDWTIVVSGRPVMDDGLGEFHDCGLAAYLTGLASGRISAAALGDWPGPNPQFRRAGG
jgi:hypothetical protein